jgi:hypothetical protein
MLLPSKTFENSLLIALPEDFESQAAYRCAVSIIADAETQQSSTSKQEIIHALEDHGFEIVDYILGPEIA